MRTDSHAKHGDQAKPDGRPRVADFSSHLSGPIASYLLREFGADVIKIEHPVHGDGLRALTPNIGGAGKYHVGVNAGARSLTVSTRSPHWTTIVDRVARWADVVIVGSRPVDASRLGLGFDALHDINPDLIYCAISGYGNRGPWSEYKAHGLNPEAFSGQLPLEWSNDGQPVTAPGFKSAGTPLAGVFGALGILAALYRRSLGDPQRHVTVSLWGASMWWNWRDLNLLWNTGEDRTDYRALGTRYAMYATGDGRALLVCPIEKHFWQRFCDAAELPATMRARGTWATTHVDYGYPDEAVAIAQAISRRPLHEWIEVLDRAEVPFAPVLTAAEAMHSEHAEANHVMRRVPTPDGTTASVVASPVRLLTSADDGGEPRPLGPPPELGADTESILRELGVPEVIDALGPR